MSAALWGRLRAAEGAAREELGRVPGWLWDGRPPVPVELLADSHYGLRVEEETALGRRLGRAGPVSGLLLPGERLIVVDAEEAERWPARRRFTVAHELGHWVLHRTEDAPVFCRRAEVREAPEVPAVLGYPPPELEANGFAAALLMPRELVLAGPGEDETLRAALFGVSAEALRRRLWALGNGL